MMFSKASQTRYRGRKTPDRSKSSLGQLDATCWKWFSRVVRLEAADRNRMVRCYTCDRRMPIIAAEAGHYITRDRKATKFDRRNVHAQCHWCNGDTRKKGNQGLHGIRIDRQYGAGTAELLQNIGAVRGARIGRLEYERMIEELRAETNRLLAEKGIEKWW
jgi:hypothetical protein